jgi:hypothetical protein
MLVAQDLQFKSFSRQDFGRIGRDRYPPAKMVKLLRFGRLRRPLFDFEL